MRRLLVTAGLVLAVMALACDAAALVKGGPGVVGRGGLNVRLGPAATAPLDTFTTPSGAYSFRKLRTAYTGPAIRIRRASDNAEIDVGFLGVTGFTGAPWDEAAALAHCAATTCTARTRYDQSGNERDLVQTTAGNQPALVFNCNGALPCLRTTAGTHALLTAGNVTPATGLASFGAVANRSVTAGIACAWIRENGNNNRLVAAAGANTWGVANLGPNGTATDGAWHAAAAVITPGGGTSVLNIDGVETTNTSATPNTTAGTAGLAGGAGNTCLHAEEIFWDNYTLSAAERAALVANQRNFWQIP